MVLLDSAAGAIVEAFAEVRLTPPVVSFDCRSSAL